ncbi:MAG: hypothetical protein C0484_09270 [Rhodospirillum sp.]|jgi:hypothetical protein|nr:hypothetical protein [Rhodospirillum sp.]
MLLEVLVPIVLVAIAVIGLQIWAIRAWQGVWRWLAAAPLLLAGADLILILVSTAIDPTSHNLWPLELAMILLIGLPVIGVLWLVRLVAKI